MVLTMIGLGSLGLAVWVLPQLRLDLSSAGYLRETDPIVQQFDEFQLKFSDFNLIFLAVRTPELFTADNLGRLSRLQRDLETLPGLRRIESVLNADHIYGAGDQVVVEDYLAS